MTRIATEQYFDDQRRQSVLKKTPLFFRLFAKIAQNVKEGALIFTLPTGEKIGFGDATSDIRGEIVFYDYAPAQRTVLGGDIGFFESFADEQWDSPDLSSALYVIALNTENLQPGFHGTALITWFDRLRHRLRKNSKAGSRKNISAHYDLGNAFYEKWLDSSMTYSSAMFADDTKTLDQAQNRKYAELAKQLHIAPGDLVLEIGSGWGGFAEFAARDLKANIVGITLSTEQLNYAKERVFRAGLAEKVEFRIQDYRDIVGTFDRIVSIEMFEAVGREYWTTYFSKIRDSLKPEGVAGIQVITIADRLYENYAAATDFIQRYVFPGGMLPSPSKLDEAIGAAGLSQTSKIRFGQDYATTLAQWHAQFVDAWQEISRLGFDDRFYKLWRFYLSYCEAGFRAGATDVVQISATKR